MKHPLAALVITAALTASAHAGAFTYHPPGDLISGSGTGRVDEKVYAPGIAFPTEEEAYLNSQVYMAGGYLGPGGGQCDAKNYSYPWRDNYCETRSWTMPLCPSGTGHQGQDLRPKTCVNNVHWVVAVTDGKITNIGSYSVYLTAPDGTRYDYLHMGSVQVAVGQDVKKGQRVGKVSNAFGGTPTTIHLHFNIRQFVANVGTVYVPPYMSLITAYAGPLNQPPHGYLDSAGCDFLRGWARDPDAPAKSIDVRLSFDDGAAEKKGDFRAAVHRDDLCEPLGYCEHGFEVGSPYSLHDGAEHSVRVHGLDDGDGPNTELDQSPQSFTCELELPPGVRRHVTDPTSFESWRFSSFWDRALVDDATLESLPLGEPLPGTPELVRGDDGSPEVWLVDGTFRRHVPSPTVAAAWRLDLGAVEEIPAAELESLELGNPLRPRPLLLQGAGPEVYLVDADPKVSEGEGGSGLPGPSSSASGGVSGPKGEGDSDVAGSCSCRTAGSSNRSSAWLAVVLGALLPWRRRRARPLA